MANVARIIVRFGLVDNTLLPNVILHVHTVGSRDPMDEVDRLALAAATRDWWTTDGASYGAVASAYPAEITLNEVVVTRVQPTVSADTIVPEDGYAGTKVNVPGVVSRFLLPPQNAALIGLRTLEDSRRGRGRVFLPCWFDVDFALSSEPNAVRMALGSFDDDDTSNFAHIASRIAEAYYDTAGYDPGTFIWCVYSAVDGFGRAVTHFAIAQHVRTQRRRALHPSPHTGYGLDGTPV